MKKDVRPPPVESSKRIKALFLRQNEQESRISMQNSKLVLSSFQNPTGALNQNPADEAQIPNFERMEN